MTDILGSFRKSLADRKLIAKFNSSKTELMIRCPFCGDSRRDKLHTHFYIQNKSPYKYYCQRCNAKGYLNNVFFNAVEFDDEDTIILVNKQTKAFFKNTSVTRENLDSLEKILDLKYPKFDLSGIFGKKKSYVEERLKIDLTKKDLLKYKMINSIVDLVVLNKIKNIIAEEKLFEFIENNDDEMVSFLSYDNSHVISRFYDGNHDRRYHTLNLMRPHDLGYKIFTIENEINLFEPEIEVVMAEGWFDIVSVYHNFYKEKDNTKRIFVAVNGKYYNLIPNLINRLGFLNLSLHIYSDAEISPEIYRYMLNMKRIDGLTLSYNTFGKEKDFGVSKDKIKIKNIKLK